MLSGHDLTDHRLFRGLPDAELARLAQVAEEVRLTPGEVVGEAGRRFTHAHFLQKGVISLFASGNGAPDIGVGLIVAHGVFGLPAATGNRRSVFRAISQGQATVYRIGAVAFAEQVACNADFRERVFRYTVSLLTQHALTIACVGQHSSQMRLARWMLDVTEGLRSASFSSTQDAMATAIGVQRAVVSKVAGHFQALGLIAYIRGEVTVLDRPGLSGAACACNVRRLRFARSA